MVELFPIARSTLVLFNWFGGIAAICWYILLIAGLWELFVKAGQGGWKALIPIYHFYILFKISWSPRTYWFWLLLSLLSIGCIGYGGYLYELAVFNGAGHISWYIPVLIFAGFFLLIIQTYVMTILWYFLSVSFGHGIGYTLGLLLLNPLFIMILGFGHSIYLGNAYKSLRKLVKGAKKRSVSRDIWDLPSDGTAGSGVASAAGGTALESGSDSASGSFHSDSDLDDEDLSSSSTSTSAPKNPLNNIGSEKVTPIIVPTEKAAPEGYEPAKEDGTVIASSDEK